MARINKSALARQEIIETALKIFSVAPMLIGVPEAVYDVFLGTSANKAGSTEC